MILYGMLSLDYAQIQELISSEADNFLKRVGRSQSELTLTIEPYVIELFGDNIIKFWVV